MSDRISSMGLKSRRAKNVLLLTFSTQGLEKAVMNFKNFQALQVPAILVVCHGSTEENYMS